MLVAPDSSSSDHHAGVAGIAGVQLVNANANANANANGTLGHALTTTTTTTLTGATSMTAAEVEEVVNSVFVHLVSNGNNHNHNMNMNMSGVSKVSPSSLLHVSRARRFASEVGLLGLPVIAAEVDVVLSGILQQNRRAVLWKLWQARKQEYQPGFAESDRLNKTKSKSKSKSKNKRLQERVQGQGQGQGLGQGQGQGQGEVLTHKAFGVEMKVPVDRKNKLAKNRHLNLHMFFEFLLSLAKRRYPDIKSMTMAMSKAVRLHVVPYLYPGTIPALMPNQQQQQQQDHGAAVGRGLNLDLNSSRGANMNVNMSNMSLHLSHLHSQLPPQPPAPLNLNSNSNSVTTYEQQYLQQQQQQQQIQQQQMDIQQQQEIYQGQRTHQSINFGRDYQERTWVGEQQMHMQTHKKVRKR
jgi:hypothetical protein